MTAKECSFIHLIPAGKTGPAHLVVHKTHVPGVQGRCPLAGVTGLDSSGQLLQGPLMVRVELVGQSQVQLLGAGLDGAVCRVKEM